MIFAENMYHNMTQKNKFFKSRVLKKDKTGGNYGIYKEKSKKGMWQAQSGQDRIDVSGSTDGCRDHGDACGGEC